ncbi:potassium channel family protein [Methanobacterium sp.]|uniref:potassium channel family protein n=2 Tax=unclassified Methanobacterium TaxID=2627676 RepID=UPI003D661532
MQRNFKIIFNALLFIFIIIDILILMLLTVDFALNLKPTFLNIILFDLAVSILIGVNTFFILNKEKNAIHYLSRHWPDIFAVIPLAYIIILIFPNTYFIVITLFLVRILSLYNYMLKIKSIIRFTRKTKLDYATFLLLITLIFGSFIFFWFESPVNPTASTFDSSVFFMIVSMTTVGYGNTVPFTRIGQLIAITAIIVGIGYTGWVTAAMASSLIEDFRKKRQEELEEQKKVLLNIVEKLDKIENELDEIKNN